jgi:hypothetical protein
MWLEEIIFGNCYGYSDTPISDWIKKLFNKDKMEEKKQSRVAEVFPGLLELASKNKTAIIKLKEAAVHCQSYELAALIREIERTNFPEPKTETKTETRTVDGVGYEVKYGETIKISVQGEEVKAEQPKIDYEILEVIKREGFGEFVCPYITNKEYKSIHKVRCLSTNLTFSCKDECFNDENQLCKIIKFEIKENVCWVYMEGVETPEYHSCNVLKLLRHKDKGTKMSGGSVLSEDIIEWRTDEDGKENIAVTCKKTGNRWKLKDKTQQGIIDSFYKTKITIAEDAICAKVKEESKFDVIQMGHYYISELKPVEKKTCGGWTAEEIEVMFPKEMVIFKCSAPTCPFCCPEKSASREQPKENQYPKGILQFWGNTVKASFGSITPIIGNGNNLPYNEWIANNLKEGHTIKEVKNENGVVFKVKDWVGFWIEGFHINTNNEIYAYCSWGFPDKTRLLSELEHKEKPKDSGNFKPADTKGEGKPEQGNPKYDKVIDIIDRILSTTERNDIGTIHRLQFIREEVIKMETAQKDYQARENSLINLNKSLEQQLQETKDSYFTLLYQYNEIKSEEHPDYKALFESTTASYIQLNEVVKELREENKQLKFNKKVSANLQSARELQLEKENAHLKNTCHDYGKQVNLMKIQMDKLMDIPHLVIPFVKCANVDCNEKAVCGGYCAAHCKCLS